MPKDSSEKGEVSDHSDHTTGERLKLRRASLKGCITRIKNYIDANQNSITVEELECRLSLLERYFQQLLQIQDSIECQEASQESHRDEIETQYCIVKAKILKLKHSLELSTSKSSPTGENSLDFTMFPYTTKVSNLPKLTLKTFAGEYIEYTSFMHGFNSLVDKCTDLSNVQKFQHLINSLQGQALNLIEGLEMTAENYGKALDLLNARYNNKCIIFQAHVKKVFEAPSTLKGSASDIRNLVDKINVHLKALRSLGTNDDILNTIILYLVRSKLDEESHIKWEESLNFDELPTWEECAKFLGKRCQQLESRPSSSANSRQGNSSKSGIKAHRKSTILTVSRLTCVFCNRSNHSIYRCWSFAKLPVNDRYREVKKLNLCLRCLQGGHLAGSCSAECCKVCGDSHHNLLHRYVSSGGVVSSTQPSGSNSVPEINVQQAARLNTSLHSHIQDCEEDQVILATAIADIRTNSGALIPGRVLLDTGSTLNFISDEFCKKLQLKRVRDSRDISGIGKQSSKCQFKTTVTIQSRVGTFCTSFQAWILQSITGSQPEKTLNITDWNIPCELPLADPQFYLPRKIDILLGSDITYDCLIEGKRRISPEYPILKNTALGWVVGGRYRSTAVAKNTNILLANENSFIDGNDDTSRIIERFWRVETVESKGSNWTQEQMECEEHFKKYVSQIDGRFKLRLPFRRDRHLLGKSHEIAIRRFMSLERRLEKDTDLKSKYVSFMREYESLGHMKLAEIGNDRVSYFIPHHPVLRPESSSTKLRVVFDASCKTSSNISLNELLMCGPVVQNDLFSIVVRFRCHKFAITADIPKMYRQIWISEEDWSYQAILWRESPSDTLNTYFLKTVTYGTTSAPFQATRCLNYLAEQNVNEYPVGSRVIKSDFYMDDLITGADTYEEIMQIRYETEKILEQGRFQLKKWFSNEERFRDSISEADKETPLRINDVDVIKTLGIIWDPFEDQFCFRWPLETNSSRVTKRIVLSNIASFFDPLGLLNPITVLTKIFMQQLWTLQVDWDQSIPEDLSEQWYSFREELMDISKIRIPRYIFGIHPLHTRELHGFADASCKAYGCCLYVRSVDSYGNISVNLISGKSKVAPLKSLSLPRLELCAALLLSNLLKVVQPLVGSLSATYLWTDSEIVLHWLHGHPSTWTTFVSNRVAEIQELTLPDAAWRHVSSKSNPADIVSRGARTKELVESIWFTGPQFLKKSEDEWPPTKLIDHAANLPDKRNVKPVLLAVENNYDLIANHKFVNDFSKLRRIFAYVLRFYRILSIRCKGSSHHKEEINKELTATELDKSLHRIIFVIQRQAFERDISLLEKDMQVSPSSSLKGLTPFLDESTPQLLRVGGRLQNSSLPYLSRHPILLPKNHPFVFCYVNYIHKSSLHAGVQALIAIIRQKFWIQSAKSVANWVVRKCVHCFHYRPKIQNQIMGPLPALRLQAIRAFAHSGVDFCGPFWTTFKHRGQLRVKSYLAVFICFATKATHLEVVSDLSADAFIAALKRFVGRRGICSTLSCDNATNFVGANSKLKEFRKGFYSQQNKEATVNYCAEVGIEFRFIPPRSPHFGGLWEAAVKSAKYHIVRTIGLASLTFEELSTVAVQVEAILNSRPMAAMSNDPNDYSALTPGHFLVNAPLNAIPETDFTKRELHYLKRWQMVCAIQQHFWQRWSREYVPQLQQKVKWTAASSNLKEDTLVLLANEDLPPQRWLLGRIVKVFPGSDGRIRVVDVRTNKGIFRRAITKIAPLPLDD